ncbi:hypothetical protein BGZ60DRAFT_380922 [Tricladium varicosporioides]|nr:hypothetical protein BGZ60DRAFT_380922 [Hymenoscyphus varicosporioides]
MSYGNGHQNGHHEGVPQAGPPAPASANGGESAKGNRLRKACDSCSIRKVKCDESGPPCRACHALEIPCTFDRPSRRRGPPNKHAENIKRQRLEQTAGGGPNIGAGMDPALGGNPGALNYSSPSSPNNVAATLASFSSHAVLNAESICPFSTLELLVDDFFTYIHPLCPFPHEPTFRLAFKHREDLKNPSFLALLAAMVGTLVASFPRKPRLHLKAQNREHLFPNSISLVERCHKVAVQARGSGYLDKELSVYDACTSYFLGLSGAYTFNWRQCRLYFGETLTITRVLGAHKERPGYLAVGALPAVYGANNSDDGTNLQNPPVDYIKREIGRRLFWIMFVGIRSMQQLGASFGELLIPPETPNEPYPSYPTEVDDEFIGVDYIEPQPPGIVAKLTGFNMNIKVFRCVDQLVTMEMAYGIDNVFDWNRQKRVLEESLRSVKNVLRDMLPALSLRPNPQSSELESRGYFPPNYDFPGNRLFNGLQSGGAGDERRNVQLEIQKANIFASQLATRSYIVEKYWNLHIAHENMKKNQNAAESVLNSPGVVAAGLDGLLPNRAPTSNHDMIESNVATERESIVKDLLNVLACINQVNMEPNGGSFINKIRQIASTLIEGPQERKGPYAVQNENYLKSFLDVLMKLERVSPGIKSETGEVDEEEELRNWADLRENQQRFAAAGGFINEIG